MRRTAGLFALLIVVGACGRGQSDAVSTFGPDATKTPLALTKTASPRPTNAPYRERASVQGAAATASPTPGPTPVPIGASVANCQLFPSDNPWRRDISNDPVDPHSSDYIAAISGGGERDFLHADFGSNKSYGIPYVTVPKDQAKVPIKYTAYGSESDKGPFPIPLNAPVEAGSDHHVLVAQKGTCKLFELYRAKRTTNGWAADSGAKFDLNSNALRPSGWTSADAAGLPILPGLVRRSETKAGAILHALRFTAPRTQAGYVDPARHYASDDDDASLPPMGARFRLKASFDLSGYTGHARVILGALKTYGMLLADNGSSWFISGARDSGWDDDDLNQLKSVPGTAFEAVQHGTVHG